MSVGDDDDFESGSLGESGSLEDDDDDDDDEDNLESTEPKLNFVRIKNDLMSILEKDSVSCVAVHSKVSLSIAILEFRVLIWKTKAGLC